MNLIPTRWRPSVRAARNAYFAVEEDPAVDGHRQTLRTSADPEARSRALAYFADREQRLHTLHDAAFGHTSWPDESDDAATSLAYGAMILTLLFGVELARATGSAWDREWAPSSSWIGEALGGRERELANACAALLDRLAVERDPEEVAVLYTRLWITAYPLIGGQAAEWIASLGNDFQCRAAGVEDGPETVLVLPDAGRGAVQFLPTTG